VGWERPNRLFTELLYSHWIAGTIRGATNRLVGRSRPYEDQGARDFAIDGGSSFPSGHASTIFQVAAVLSHHARSTPVSIVVYSLASAAALERITSQQHWASDVWLGAAYGWAVAKLVIRLHEEDALRVEPVVLPSGGMGMSVRIPL
jgi:membrane-associated phospholipid phosphatase